MGRGQSTRALARLVMTNVMFQDTGSDLQRGWKWREAGQSEYWVVRQRLCFGMGRGHEKTGPVIARVSYRPHSLGREKLPQVKNGLATTAILSADQVRRACVVVAGSKSLPSPLRSGVEPLGVTVERILCRRQKRTFHDAQRRIRQAVCRTPRC